MRISSTLLWERAVHDLQVNAPFRWLRASLLLFLQLVALALFCVALARPAIDSTGPPADRVILLIDTSASMNATDAATGGDPPTSRLNEAKSQAIKILARLDATTTGSGGRVEAAVVSFALAPRAITGFTSSQSELRRAIGLIEPTDQPADLASALKLVGALVHQRGPAGGSTRVLLIGDGSYPDADSVGLSGAELRFVRVGPDPASLLDNLGVVALDARRDLNDPSLVRLFVRVVNASDKSVSAPITLRLDDEPINTRMLQLPGRTTDGPGQAATTFQFRDAPTGEAKLATVQLGRKDALAADNAAAIRLNPAIPPRILIVTPVAMNAAQTLADDLLTKALAAIGARIIDTIDGPTFNQMKATPERLDRYDLIVVDGAGVLWLPPTPTIAFGAVFISRSGITMDALRYGPQRFTYWKRLHPILRQVNLDSVYIANTIGSQLPNSSPDEMTDRQELAFGNGRPLITLWKYKGVDRLNVGFELSQSNWPTQVSFVVFLTNAVEQLTGMIGSATGASSTTTQPIIVRPEPGAFEISVTGPVKINRSIDKNDRAVSLGVLPRAGVYHVSSVDRRYQLVPVNMLDAGESAIQTSDAVTLADASARASAAGARAPRELWRWFVFAALIVLTAEWLIYVWRMRL